MTHVCVACVLQPQNNGGYFPHLIKRVSSPLKTTLPLLAVNTKSTRLDREPMNEKARNLCGKKTWVGAPLYQNINIGVATFKINYIYAKYWK